MRSRLVCLRFAFAAHLPERCPRPRNVNGCFVAAALCLLLAAPATPRADDKPEWKTLFDGKTLAGWKSADLGGDGAVTVRDGALILSRGKPMTGLVYTRGDFPKTGY